MKSAGIVVLMLYLIYPVTSQPVYSGTIMSVLESTAGLRKSRTEAVKIIPAGSSGSALFANVLFIEFAQWIYDAGVEHLYNGREERTVFAFNDTVYNNLRSDTRGKFDSMSSNDKGNYVMSYTLANRITVDQLPNPGNMQSMLGRKLYFIKRNRQYWSSTGTAGLTATYVNGAMIVREQITTSNGVIHVLGHVPSQISTKMVYEWLKDPTDSGRQASRFLEMLSTIEGDFYTSAVAPLTHEGVTLFLPSERALGKIPSQSYDNLRGELLANYIQMHYIPNQVVYTSYVENSDNYQSGYKQSRIVFRRFEDKVYVISGGVTAEIIEGNITVSNGVIHVIDRMLGFVYFNAREQIKEDAPKFSEMIRDVSTELSTLISQSNGGLNMFVPLDIAFHPWIDYRTNRSLIDMVIRLCMVKDGDIEVSQLNANYDGRQRRTSRYNQWQLVIFNDRNVTWVNGGNVLARIVKPDIKVNGGRLQYIDQVLGVPSMDIPGVIYYDDYLYRTYTDLHMVGLARYMQDPRLDNNQYTNNLPHREVPILLTTTTTTQYPGQQYPNNNQQYPNNNQNNQQYPNNNQQYPNNNQNNQQYPNNNQNNQQYPNNNQQYPNQQNQYGPMYPPGPSSYGRCGDQLYPCEFTFFVPNGTAIENFYNIQYGYRIVQDINRYRFLFRRLIIPNIKISLDHLSPGRDASQYRTHSGEMLIVRKESDLSVRLMWKSQSARVIMWDVAGTNGMVHIIDQLLSDPNDISIDVSRASMLGYPALSLLSCLALLSMLFFC